MFTYAQLKDMLLLFFPVQANCAKFTAHTQNHTKKVFSFIIW